MQVPHSCKFADHTQGRTPASLHASARVCPGNPKGAPAARPSSCRSAKPFGAGSGARAVRTALGGSAGGALQPVTRARARAGTRRCTASLCCTRWTAAACPSSPTRCWWTWHLGRARSRSRPRTTPTTSRPACGTAARAWSSSTSWPTTAPSTAAAGALPASRASRPARKTDEYSVIG